MLSHNFFVHGQAPWGESTSLSEMSLETSRKQILQGRFEGATKTLSDLIANPNKPEHLEWAYLLRCYTYRLDAYLRHGVERQTLLQMSNFDYTCAFKINADLAYKECQGYGLIVTWLECLIDVYQIQEEKLNFPKLHEQVWCIFSSDNLFHSGKASEALKQATAGLESFPLNHFLLFTRSAAWLSEAVDKANPALLEKAEEDLTLAIHFCPVIPRSAPNLARYYFHRGQVRYMQKQVDGMLDDFKMGMEFDYADNDAFDTQFRLATLKQVLMAYIIPSISLDKPNSPKLKQIKHLTAELIKQRTQSDLYLNRGKLYAELGRVRYAIFDYSLALWLIKTRLDASPGCTQKVVEARLERLKTSSSLSASRAAGQLVEAPSPLEEEKKPAGVMAKPEASKERDQTTLDKKKQKRERQKKAKEQEKQKQETEKFFSGLVQQVVDRAKTLIAGNEETKRKQEEERQKKLKEEQKKKQKIAQKMQNTIYQLVEKAIFVVKEKERQQEEARERKREELRKERALLVQEMQGTVYRLAEKAALLAEENKQKREQERLNEQERVIFPPVGRVFIPTVVAECGRRLKALPGRAAKRTHLYGGVARDEMLMNQRESLDYDLRTGLPLKEAAAVLKAVFNLAEEPREEYGLLQLSFPVVSASGLKKMAVLALSHSEHLANEDISYAEALKRDARSFDFIQNALVALFPESGSLCPVFYPLDWWELYFSVSPASAAVQLERTRQKDGLSMAMAKLTGHAIFLAGEGREVKVNIFMNGWLEMSSPNLRRELTFNFELQEADRELLIQDENGRVLLTPKNQNRFKQILGQLNEKYQQVRHLPLDRAKGKLVDRLLMTKYMEPILEGQLSFARDPIRMLRAIYFTTALGYSGLSESVEQAIYHNLPNYSTFIQCNPGKLNSWMNKLFCRDGKPKLMTHFNWLLKLGLLQCSFPGLSEAIFGDEKIRRWLNDELGAVSCAERPSLNYLYGVFIVCLAVSLRKSPQEIIQNNLLFAVNFKELNPDEYLRAAFSSWQQFLQKQAVPPQLKVNVNVNVQVNQFQYVNVEGKGPAFFSGQAAKKNQQTSVQPVYSPRL